MGERRDECKEIKNAIAELKQASLKRKKVKKRKKDLKNFFSLKKHY